MCNLDVLVRRHVDSRKTGLNVPSRSITSFVATEDSRAALAKGDLVGHGVRHRAGGARSRART